MKKKCIALSGTNRAGKGTFVHLLRDYTAVTLHSVSEHIKLRMAQQTVDRDALIAFSNTYRQAHGGAIFIETLYKGLAQGLEKINVIESIRTPDEVAFCKAHDIPLVFIDADPEIRFMRSQHAREDKDPPTREKFMQQDMVEWDTYREPYQQNLRFCKEHASLCILNNGDPCALVPYITPLLASV